MNQDHYETLGIKPGASASQIKAAYRKKALAYHPDRNPGNEVNAATKFKKISAAYETLTCNSRRISQDSHANPTGNSRIPTYEEFLRDLESLDEQILNSAPNPFSPRHLTLIALGVIGGAVIAHHMDPTTSNQYLRLGSDNLYYFVTHSDPELQRSSATMIGGCLGAATGLTLSALHPLFHIVKESFRYTLRMYDAM